MLILHSFDLVAYHMEVTHRKWTAHYHFCHLQSSQRFHPSPLRRMSLKTQFYIEINVKKTCQFRTQCKGVKSHIQNCTNHFGEDT